LRLLGKNTTEILLLIPYTDDTGLILEESFVIQNRSAKVLEFPKFLPSIGDYTVNKPKSIWCIVEGEKYGLSFFSVTCNKDVKSLFW